MGQEKPTLDYDSGEKPQLFHFASFSAGTAFRFGFFFAMGATLFIAMLLITLWVIRAALTGHY